MAPERSDDGPMNEKITVGFDGTGPASEAVMWAADEAVVRGARLHIVSCFDSPALMAESSIAFGSGAAFEAMREVAAAALQKIAHAVAAAHPALAITTEVSPGPITTALLAGATPDDLVVVGSSHHDHDAAFWLGSTPRFLVRHSACPVAVVRGAASRGKPDRVVVGTDGSPASDTAVRWAGDEADRHGVELTIIHGWEYLYLPPEAPTNRARDLTEVDAACTLERSVELATERNGARVTSMLVENTPVGALLDSVRDGDLLVVGASGRGALRSRLFGSTVNSVLDGCAVPVIVVRGDASTTHAGVSVAREDTQLSPVG